MQLEQFVLQVAHFITRSVYQHTACDSLVDPLCYCNCIQQSVLQIPLDVALQMARARAAAIRCDSSIYLPPTVLGKSNTDT